MAASADLATGLVIGYYWATGTMESDDDAEPAADARFHDTVEQHHTSPNPSRPTGLQWSCKLAGAAGDGDATVPEQPAWDHDVSGMSRA